MQETQLYLQDVHKAFDGYKAINGLSIAIARGELRAVVGPNGAGKTTMLDIITGKTRPDVGQVVWGQDTDLTRLDEASCARLGIGRKFQKPTVFETLSVSDNLMLALANDRGVPATLFHRGSQTEAQRIAGLLETVGLGAERERLAGLLSHGQKQWLEIGMLLMQEPELLMLDEPIAGMSARERELTAELLKRICKGRSVIVIEHDMEFVKQIAHKVTVMHQGKILAEGSMEAVQADPKVIDVYLGH